MKTKFLSTLLVVILLCTSFNSIIIHAESLKKFNTLETLVYKGNGIFTKVDSSFSINNNEEKSSRTYKIKKKENNLYEIVGRDDLPFKYLIKVANGQFLLVGEKKVDLNKIDEVLKDNRISNFIKSDIKDISMKIKDERQKGISFTIYSPDLLNFSTISTSEFSTTSETGWFPTIYYTGYQNLKYKDEILYINGYVSDTAERVMSQSEYTKMFANVFWHFVGEGLSKIPIVGSYLSFALMFGQDYSYGGSTGDRIKVYITENKWRKYTSVMYPSNDYKLGAITDHIYLNIYTDKFKSGNPYPIRSAQENIKVESPSYVAPDVKAYQYKSSLGYWNEKIDFHELYGFSFRSAD